jgi:DNA-binding transcriptional MerR regulator
MFSIGEFARHGRVSVRMLRHYDAVGLLRPAFVDPGSGYRFYQAGQLAQLNRIIALKDLGFSLQQVQAILEEQVSAAELRGMLRLRRAEIHAQIETESARLARVEARLLTIEEEGRARADGVVIKRLTPMRVGELTGTAASYEPTGQALARWIDDNGYHSVGYAREVTLEWSPDPDEWVTELQQPIYATGGLAHVSDAGDRDSR